MGKGKDPLVCNLVFTWNRKRKARDDAILDAWVKLVGKKAAQKAKIGHKRGWASIAKTDGDTEKTIIGVDMEALAKKRKLCGFAGVVYDAGDSKFAEIVGYPQQDKDPRPVAVQAANAYHELNRIEDCFKCMKSYFGLRPVRVWNSTHVESHVYICFLALLLVRLLQRKLRLAGVKLSLDELLDCLRNAKLIATPPDNNKNTNFISVELDPLPLGVSPWLSRDEVCKLIEERAARKSNIGKVLDAVGLREPQAVSHLEHLEYALKTRFYGLEGAIPREWLSYMKEKCCVQAS